MSPRALVTGGGGFLGSHVLEGLLGEGAAVRALARATNVPRWLTERGAEIVVGDVTRSEVQAAACEGCDVVVHAASLVTEVAVPDSEYFRVNAEASEELARMAARCGVKRFVFVSSTSVHRPNSGRPLDEMTAVDPEDAYSRSKAEAERRLAAVAAATGPIGTAKRVGGKITSCSPTPSRRGRRLVERRASGRSRSATCQTEDATGSPAGRAARDDRRASAAREETSYAPAIDC